MLIIGTHITNGVSKKKNFFKQLIYSYYNFNENVEIIKLRLFRTHIVQHLIMTYLEITFEKISLVHVVVCTAEFGRNVCITKKSLSYA